MHEEMPRLLSGTDIYVSTSLDDGTSISLLEAMASGAFPIVSDIPSNREWICDGENGFLVPTHEERVLAARIVETIRNRSLVEKAKQRNLHVVKEKALWSVTIEKTKRIYEMILSEEN
jgi:glycosyltransferase involved in cell wall biosynthesis